MARHSKWHNIKHKKAAEDAKKGKIFTKHAKLIAIAARSGADPSSNPLLKAMIDNAKAVNVPNDNIERAIKKGAGAEKNAAVYEEMLYEGFGPGGIALLIQAITDKKNRALGDIKVVMGRKGGRMAESGSVAWMFKKVGEIVAVLPEPRLAEKDELLLAAVDLGVDQYDEDGENFRFLMAPEKLGQVRDGLLSLGYQIESAVLGFEPNNRVEISEDAPERTGLELLLETLEGLDDVDEIYTNLA